MTAKSTTAGPASEEQMVHLVRNALLVAGQEMGDGDQWPVVKDTIHKLMKDWEDLRIERNVDEELKKHLYQQIAVMEAALPECGPVVRAHIEPKIRAWREACDAYFCEIDSDAVYRDADEAPDHIQRMKLILATLEDTNE